MLASARATMESVLEELKRELLASGATVAPDEQSLVTKILRTGMQGHPRTEQNIGSD